MNKPDVKKDPKPSPGKYEEIKEITPSKVWPPPPPKPMKITPPKPKK